MQSLAPQATKKQPEHWLGAQLPAHGLPDNTKSTHKTRLIGGGQTHPAGTGLNANGVLLYQSLKSQLNNEPPDQAKFKPRQSPARHKKQALQISLCIEKMAELYGLQNIAFQTLTFKENLTDPKEAQRRFNSLATNVLKPRYGEYIAIRERQKRGAIHYHLLVPVFNDIRTGFDWSDLDTAKTLPRGKRYPSASPALRAEWRFWRQTAPSYGFGRTELLPVRSSREAISAYIGKYLGKDLQNSTPEDKGARRISITSGIRAGTIHFQLLNSSTKQWRQNVAKFAQLVGRAYHCEITKFSDLTQKLGPRWAYLNATMINDLTNERMALYTQTPRDRLRAWIIAETQQTQSEIEEMKTCTVCRQTKPEAEYNKNRSRPDGLNSQCRPCHRNSANTWARARRVDKPRIYAVDPAHHVEAPRINRHWYIPDTSFLEEIPKWKT